MATTSTYTKADLIADLNLHELFADASKRQVTDFVNDLFESIADKVAEGTTVSIAKFGKFYPYERTIEGKPTGVIVPKFKAFSDFKDSLAR